MLPLNGTKTHPLSTHALDVLSTLSHAPTPASKVNPGVINRLQRQELVEIVELPSPFRTHEGAKIPHLKITEAGIKALADTLHH